MITRLLYKQLQEWRDRPNHKPLVLRGARQVGKTTLVNEFGKEFDHYIRLNLELADDARAFSLSDRVSDVFQYICLLKKVVIQEHEQTLLFIDEIQNEPKAVAMLRYFYEEMPDLYVIAAGSRLHTLLKQRISFPVGRVEYLSLRPCSFLEYLYATGEKPLADLLTGCQVPPHLHDLLMKRFNRYALVGGMPEVLNNFASHQDVSRLSPIYQSLLNGYDEDVEKYAKNEKQIQVLRHILRHGWSLAGQTIKFAKFGGSSYSSQEVHDAFEVLQKAFLLHLDYPVTTMQVPAMAALTRSPKLIWVDTGIVNFSSDIQTAYLQNTDLLDIWRGHAAEQVVAQELRIALDRNYRNEQFFWVRDKKGATAEVDFVWQQGTRLIPIEVKTGTNAHLRSLHSMMSQPDAPDLAVRVWSGAYREDELTTASGVRFRLLSIPFYYACMIDYIIDNAS